LFRTLFFKILQLIFKNGFLTCLYGLLNKYNPLTKNFYALLCFFAKSLKKMQLILKKQFTRRLKYSKMLVGL